MTLVKSFIKLLLLVMLAGVGAQAQITPTPFAAYLGSGSPLTWSPWTSALGSAPLSATPPAIGLYCQATAGGPWTPCVPSGGGGGGTTTNPLTGAVSGGAAPGTTFNGSSAITFDYHTFGADQLGSAAAAQAASAPLVNPVGGQNNYAPVTTPTYYVDNVNGLDTNNGTTVLTPWKTIAKINATTLTAGQTVAFKSGDEWHEALTIAQSGSSGAPITYTSYGNGAQPIISASDTVTGWTQGAGLPAQEVCTGTCVYRSGMETTSFTDWGSVTQTGGTIAQSTSQVAHGSFSAAMTGNGTDNRTWLTSPAFTAWATGHTYGVRIYVYIPSSSLSATAGQLKYVETSTGDFWSLNCGSAGCTGMSFVGGGGGVFITTLSTSAITLNAWHYIEVDYTVSATVGGVTAFVDGNSIGSSLTSNTSADVGITSLEVGQVGFGGPQVSGGVLYFDDYQYNTSPPIGAFNSGGAFPTTVWSHAQTTNPFLPNFLGQTGVPVSSLGSVVSPNQFYWDGSSNLYVYSGTDPTNVVEIPARSTAAAASTPISYVSFTNLEFRGAQTFDVSCVSTSCPHWSFENDTFNDSYYYELQIAGSEGTSASGPSVHNSTFKGAGGSGINLANVGATGASIVGNQFYNLCNVYTGSNFGQFCDAIDFFSSNGSDGTGSYVAYNNIHDIAIHAVGAPSYWGNGMHADTVSGTLFEHNTIQNVSANGAFIEKGTGNTMQYNQIYNAGLNTFQGGLYIRAGDGQMVNSATMQNNTVVGGYWTCAVNNDTSLGSAGINNFTFARNICTGGVAQNLFATTGYNGTGDTYPTNNFGVAATNFVAVAGTTYSTYGSLPALFSTSIPGDPQYISLAAQNFGLQSTSPAIGLGAYPVFQPVQTNTATQTYLQIANNLSDIASASAARSSLGLGTSAILNTGTSGANIPLLNTANTWSSAQTFAAISSTVVTPTGTAPTVASATTVAIVTNLASISGTAAISSITPETGFTFGCKDILATGAWTTVAGASANNTANSMTAVSGTEYRACKFSDNLWHIK